MKLGSGRATPVDVRVIAATHRDLHALVEQGAFRADLYFRLNLLQIELPPLRERRGDIALLARHLLSRSALQYGLADAALSRVLTFLGPLFEHYAWPGNVRELENLLARAAIFLGDATFTMIEILKADQPRVAAMLDAPLEKAKNLQNAFLYAQGARYVKALKERGGWASVNAAYKFPPRSTAA